MAGHTAVSRTFESQRAARTWAITAESELLARKRGEIIPRSVRAALVRYAAEVAPKHKGERWEQIRLKKFERTLPFIDRQLSIVRSADIAAWRDSALETIAPPSVRREMVLLRSVLEVCRREWGWLATNPMTDTQMPKHGASRSRRISDAEADQLVAALGYARATTANTVSQRVAVAFLLAMETGMRAGELLGLQWAHVDRETRAAHLLKTKNGTARVVPLSSPALALLDLLPPTGASVFQISSSSLDALFRKAKKRAGIVGMTFHDTRHEAITRLARKLDVLDLARMIGHRDLRSLQVYYNATPAEIAARLDR